jgi:hypothetical protein
MPPPMRAKSAMELAPTARENTNFHILGAQVSHGPQLDFGGDRSHQLVTGGAADNAPVKPCGKNEPAQAQHQR